MAYGQKKKKKTKTKTKKQKKKNTQFWALKTLSLEV